MNVTTSVRHVPAHALFVFHTYVYVPVSASYVSALPPVLEVGNPVIVVAAPLAGHASGLDDGDPAAKMASPLSPPRLNFTGTLLPAVAAFSLVAAIGDWNPPNLYADLTT